MDAEFEELVKTCTTLNIVDLGGRQVSINRWLNFFRVTYFRVRRRRCFSNEEMLLLLGILPRIDLLEAIVTEYYSGVFGNLMMRSIVAFLIDDFPHLRSILYTEQMEGLERKIEEWNRTGDPPFLSYYDDYVQTRDTCKILPSSHWWWKSSLREKPTHIQGVEVNKKRRDEYNYAQRQRTGRNRRAARKPLTVVNLIKCFVGQVAISVFLPQSTFIVLPLYYI